MVVVAKVAADAGVRSISKELEKRQRLRYTLIFISHTQISELFVLNIMWTLKGVK